MARNLITDYAMLMKAIGRDFQMNSSMPLNTTKLYGLISERYGSHEANKCAVVPVYEYRINIPSDHYNFIYLIDSRTDEKGNRCIAIRDGVYVYDEYVICVINIDCGLFYRDVDFKDVATFFENFRNSISSIFINSILRATDSIFISYFGAFCAIHSAFAVDKEAMIAMQQYMKTANKVIDNDNKIYENMISLFNANNVLYLNVCRAYEDGVNNVESNIVPVTTVVPSLQQGEN